LLQFYYTFGSPSTGNYSSTVAFEAAASRFGAMQPTNALVFAALPLGRCRSDAERRDALRLGAAHHQPDHVRRARPARRRRQHLRPGSRSLHHHDRQQHPP
jgi:hypothetical protein